MENVNEYSPSVLAFVGDAVYGLKVRTYISKENRKSKDLHSLSVEYVKAPAQAAAYKKIEPVLSESEKEIFRRGRNFHTNNTPKSASIGEYHTATGLECLFGYLYLSGNEKRIDELFQLIVK